MYILLEYHPNFTEDLYTSNLFIAQTQPHHKLIALFKIPTITMSLDSSPKEGSMQHLWANKNSHVSRPRSMVNLPQGSSLDSRANDQQATSTRKTSPMYLTARMAFTSTRHSSESLTGRGGASATGSMHQNHHRRFVLASTNRSWPSTSLTKG